MVRRRPVTQDDLDYALYYVAEKCLIPRWGKFNPCPGAEFRSKRGFHYHGLSRADPVLYKSLHKLSEQGFMKKDGCGTSSSKNEKHKSS